MGHQFAPRTLKKKIINMKVFAAILGLILVLNASNGVSAACSNAVKVGDLIQKEAGDDADPDAICDAAKKMSMDEVMDKLEGYANEQGWSDGEVADAAKEARGEADDDADADDDANGADALAAIKENCPDVLDDDVPDCNTGDDDDGDADEVEADSNES